MNKTKKSIYKRFKITNKGKVLYRKSGKRHFLRNKTKNQKKRMKKYYCLNSKIGKKYKKMIL